MVYMRSGFSKKMYSTLGRCDTSDNVVCVRVFNILYITA